MDLENEQKPVIKISKEIFVVISYGWKSFII